MIGKVVGNYKIISELGEGGVGTVYKGVDTMLDREVAIKVLRPELVRQDAIVERFRSEAVTLAKLNHPNIATLFSLFRHGAELFMVLEFVEGETLEDILQRRGAIDCDEAIPIFCQALNGLNYAHQLKIIHRDIKPSNMILTNDNVLKILDFGIARLLGSSRMTKVGNIIGTLEYMSPEQIRGEETDARSDIYGLGIMLYEILTGRLPFESENEFVLMKAHTEETPVLPRQINPNIPPEIENAIVKAISKNPNERFQNADEFLQTMLDLGFSAAKNSALGFESVYQAKISATRRQQPKEEFETAVYPHDLPIEKTGENQTLILPQAADERQIQTPESLIETAQFSPDRDNSETAGYAANQVPNSAETNSDSPEIKATRLGEAKNYQTSGAQNFQTNKDEVKATRLGAMPPPQNPQAMKATRLGASAVSGTADFEQEAKPFPQAILAKLNWMHYAGAGLAAFFLLSLIGIAAVIPFLGGGSSENSNQSAVETKADGEKYAEQKPEISTVPNDQPAILEQPNQGIADGNAQPTPIVVAEEENAGKKPPTDENKKSGGKASDKGAKADRNKGGGNKGGNKEGKNGNKGGGKSSDTKPPPKLVEDLTGNPGKGKGKGSGSGKVKPTPGMTDN